MVAWDMESGERDLTRGGKCGTMQMSHVRGAFCCLDRIAIAFTTYLVVRKAPFIRWTHVPAVRVTAMASLVKGALRVKELR